MIMHQRSSHDNRIEGRIGGAPCPCGDGSTVVFESLLDDESILSYVVVPIVVQTIQFPLRDGNENRIWALMYWH